MTFYEELVAIIGRDVALQLVAKYQGRVIYFPALKGTGGASKEVRKILQLYDSGASLLAIASQMGVSIATVVDIVEEGLTINVSTTRRRITSKGQE